MEDVFNFVSKYMFRRFQICCVKTGNFIDYLLPQRTLWSRFIDVKNYFQWLLQNKSCTIFSLAHRNLGIVQLIK